jgi:hypothetical protein
MAVKYNNASNYNKTSMNKKYLNVYNPPLTRETLSIETKTIKIQSKYDRRPDLLANDLFGNSKVWWVFAHYNREKLKDPVFDFRAGMTIVVPKNFRVSG